MIHIHLACNDHRNGNFTGGVEHIQFCGTDVEPMLEVYGNSAAMALEKSANGRDRWLRLGHLRNVRVLSYTTWAGNWCWDAAQISNDDAAKIANYLRKRNWQVEAGWGDFCEKWRAEQPFVAEDFEVTE